MLIAAARLQGAEPPVRLRRCPTGDAAFTAVAAPGHPEASATVVGAAGSTPRKRKPIDGGSAN
jgi:hypothetical protein